MKNSKKYIIAIDGPAGAGKSTIAKIVAKKLGYLYIDTGAMYRALTYKALQKKIDLNDQKKLTKLAKTTKIELRQKNGKLKVYLDKKDVTKEIRKEYVSVNTNTVASIQGVRKIMRSIQRKIGKKGGVVMEGRDIGTCVFPDANFKFYLDASAEERARRRYKELKIKGEKVNFQQIKKSIEQRDYLDKTRGINPLRQAKDAIRIDSTNMTLKQVANFILRHVSTNR